MGNTWQGAYSGMKYNRQKTNISPPPSHTYFPVLQRCFLSLFFAPGYRGKRKERKDSPTYRKKRREIT